MRAACRYDLYARYYSTGRCGHVGVVERWPANAGCASDARSHADDGPNRHGERFRACALFRFETSAREPGRERGTAFRSEIPVPRPRPGPLQRAAYAPFCAGSHPDLPLVRSCSLGTRVGSFRIHSRTLARLFFIDVYVVHLAVLVVVIPAPARRGTVKPVSLPLVGPPIGNGLGAD